MNKHTPYDLKQMQSLPLDAKIIMTQERIRQWYDHWDGNVYVSFSGGKDSTVLKHIVDGMYADVPSVFVNTGLEFPEIQRFVNDIKSGKYECFNTDVEVLRPAMRFDDVIKRYGYPVVSKEVAQIIYEVRGRLAKGLEAATYRMKKLNGECFDSDGNPSRYNIPQWKYLLDAPFDTSHKCCDVMKKSPAKVYEKATKRKPYIATMAEESALRFSKWLRFGCNAFEQERATSQPMSFWTEQDVLHYLKRFGVPYAAVYGDIRKKNKNALENQLNMIDCLGSYTEDDVLETTGEKRTGCIFCLFGCHLEPTPNRIQRLKQTHPNQYNYCVNGGEYVDGKWQPSKEGLGLKKVMEYIGIPYE